MRERIGVWRKPSDPAVPCCRCDEPATITEWVPLRTGTTAYYAHCSACWDLPAANGGPSALERTGMAAPDALAVVRADAADYEQRWLAECRAHGETKRRLELAECELRRCSQCDRDPCVCDGFPIGT